MENKVLIKLKERNMSITDLAKEIKYARTFISNVLHKKTKASPRLIQTIIEVMGDEISEDDFLVSRYGHR